MFPATTSGLRHASPFFQGRPGQSAANAAQAPRRGTASPPGLRSCRPPAWPPAGEPRAVASECFTFCESSRLGTLLHMPRRSSRTSLPPTKPLARQPSRIGKLDASALICELRQLHEEAEDPDVERMPTDDEIYGALLYCEKHTAALLKLAPEKRKEAALRRVQLWEFLRERAEIHQARAIADARGAGAQWLELVPVLAVKAPSAAYNKSKRLRAAALRDETPEAEPLRRTPEAVNEAEERIARHQRAERRAEEAARRRHHLLAPVAQRLLDNRDGLVRNEDAEYWLDEVAEVLPHCTTATQMVSLSRYLSAALRALEREEQRTARPVATTDEARLARSAAAELLNR